MARSTEDADGAPSPQLSVDLQDVCKHAAAFFSLKDRCAGTRMASHSPFRVPNDSVDIPNTLQSEEK